MKSFCRTAFVVSLSLLCSYLETFAQSSEKINWITFPQLNDSLKVNPKKVFVDFYADWCTTCKQMERTTFTDEKVIELLNDDFYAVKMNIESRDSIVFGEQMFVNKRYKRVNPVHEIALLMASRKDKLFSVPVFVLLDDKFSATARYFQYLDTNSLIEILENEEKNSRVSR